MLNPPAFSLNNRSSAQKVSSRKNDVKRAYTPSTPNKKQSKPKKESKGLNRSSSNQQRQMKNLPNSILKTPKKQKVNPQKSTSKKQENYKDLKFKEITTTKSHQYMSGKNKKGGDDRFQTQNERLEMLKEYLKEDADRIRNMKLISDQHVISQVKITHDSLKRKLNEEQLENSMLIEHHRKEIQNLRNQQTIEAKKHENDLRQMNKELSQEKMRNKMLENQLKQCKAMIANLESRLAVKGSQIQYHSRRQQFIHPDALAKINHLQTEVSELENKVASFASIKRDLEEDIARHRREKQFIKKQSQEVLAFIREQYSNHSQFLF